MIALFLRPIRRRKALAALAAYSDAKDAYRRALVAGDTRKQAETGRALQVAMLDRLRTETSLRRVSA